MALAQDTNPKIKNIMPIIKIEIWVSLRLKECMDTGLFILGIDFSVVKLGFAVSLGIIRISNSCFTKIIKMEHKFIQLNGMAKINI